MTQQISALAEEMTQVAESIRDPQGTIGQLLTNPDLYQNLNDAARNVEGLTRQLRPILDDVRVFTDKISRHPGIIIRDAVQPSSGRK